MKRLAWILISWLSGLAFWFPSIIVHAIRGYQFGHGRFDVIGVSILPIAVTYLELGLLSRQRPSFMSRASIAMWMFLGIWMLGPLCIMIGASFSGGGFARPGMWHDILILSSIFPLATFDASTYDGTLGAVVLVTIWFPVAALRSLQPQGSPH